MVRSLIGTLSAFHPLCEKTRRTSSLAMKRKTRNALKLLKWLPYMVRLILAESSGGCLTNRVLIET